MRKKILFIVLAVVIIFGVILFIAFFQKGKYDVPNSQVNSSNDKLPSGTGNAGGSVSNETGANDKLPSGTGNAGGSTSNETGAIASGSPEGSRFFHSTETPAQNSEEDLEKDSKEVDVNSLNQN